MKPSPLALSAISLFFAVPALAQSNPAFTFAKPDAPKPVDVAKPGTPPPPPPPPIEWRAQVKGGFTMTSGNSETTGFVAAASASRKQGNNRLSVDANGAYGRSNVRTAVISPTPDPMTGNPDIIALTRTDVTTTNTWLLRGRYDRFFTLNNSGYVAAQAAADKVAGKTFFGGGQVGYSRQLYKSAMHLTVAEIGYDFSYERYVQVGTTAPPPVSIHSARIFAGETLTLTKATGITASVEALFNLNTETTAFNSSSTAIPPAKGVDAFEDTRVNAKIGLTTTLYNKLSVSFGFTLRYDENPALLAIPAGSPANAAFSGIAPFADKLDTLTEATLVYTFL
jgi:hypothetical protein